MSNLKVVGFLFLGLIGCALSACGSSSSTGTAASTTCATGYTYSATTLTCVYTGTTTSTTCSSGYIYSSTYGECLEQTTSCEGSYALYNGSCVLYSTTTTTATTTSTTHSPYQGSCTYGYVQTADGCLTQGVCTVGYGFGYYYGQAWCFPTDTTY